MVISSPALLREISAVLRAGGIDDPELEAAWICEDARNEAEARAIAARRAQHEPLQYLLGAWEFYGMKMRVGEGVLIPRADTETLVDAVLSRYGERVGLRVADLCTGTGCIALALKKHLRQAEVIGVELSPAAMQYAERNTALHGLDVQLVRADVLAPETAAQYKDLDIIVSNPPYLSADDMAALQPEVTREPETALFGGTDGLRFYRGITALWKDALRPGGMLAFEAGIGQAGEIAAILAAEGFVRTEILPDLCGVDRVVLGFLPEV